MKKIRIVFVETNCKKTGPIKQTLNIIKYLDRDVFDPVLITIWHEETNNSMLNDYQNLGILTYCCGLSKFKSIILGKRFLKKQLIKLKPDIVQGVGMPPYRMTLGYKSTVHFITLRNYCYEDYPDHYAKGIGTLMAYMDMNLIKHQLRKGAPFVTCSESLTKIYKEKENLSIPFIKNGVDINLYKKRDLTQIESLRRKLKLPLNKTIFVYSGGLIDRKNQQEAINGLLKMKNIKQATLLLLGDGKDKEDLEMKYGKISNVIIKGKVDNIIDYLSSSDIYISTSKSEGLPNGVLEAMAIGLPVLLSEIPQHIEILDTCNNKCGYSYPLGNLEQLAVVMDSCCVADLKTMGNNSYYSIINNFSAKHMSRLYQKKYQEIIKK